MVVEARTLLVCGYGTDEGSRDCEIRAWAVMAMWWKRWKSMEMGEEVEEGEGNEFCWQQQ